MGNEKPPDKRDPNAFEKKEKRVICPSCKGKGTIKPANAKREATCQRCKGSGYIAK